MGGEAALGADDSRGGLETTAAERERSHLARAFADGHLGQREVSERLVMGVRQFERPNTGVARKGRREASASA